MQIFHQMQYSNDNDDDTTTTTTTPTTTTVYFLSIIDLEIPFGDIHLGHLENSAWYVWIDAMLED